MSPQAAPGTKVSGSPRADTNGLGTNRCQDARVNGSSAATPVLTFKLVVPVRTFALHSRCPPGCYARGSDVMRARAGVGARRNFGAYPDQQQLHARVGLDDRLASAASFLRSRRFNACGAVGVSLVQRSVGVPWSSSLLKADRLLLSRFRPYPPRSADRRRWP
jgi:hypothetical protein